MLSAEFNSASNGSIFIVGHRTKKRVLLAKTGFSHKKSQHPIRSMTCADVLVDCAGRRI